MRLGLMAISLLCGANFVVLSTSWAANESPKPRPACEVRFSPKANSWRRLVNENDRQKAIRLGIRPDLIYGRNTIVDWMNAERFLRHLPAGTAINSNLLKSIHKIAAKNLRFHGYEGRRIRAKYLKGQIDKQEFQHQLSLVYQQNIAVSGVDHQQLAGSFREETVDEIEHHGSSVHPDGFRYFTATELAQLRLNPYIRVDESSLQEFQPGMIRGVSYFEQVKKVPASVEIAFREFNSRYQLSKGQEIYWLVAKLMRDLLSIHPFLDGNGRSIRLLGDFILMRSGLKYPKSRPVENDIAVPLEEYARDLMQVSGVLP